MKKILSLLLSFILLLQVPVFGLTSKYEKGVKVLKSPALEYESPEWFTPIPLKEAPEDLEYWTGILPYTEDRAEQMYVVLPTLGLITPVVLVPDGSKDHTDMIQGKEIDINKYLVEGVMHYAGSGLPGDLGNPVIFGHSNYFADKPGKYKSIFADIMNLDVGPTDEMRVYTKQDDGSYDLKKFTLNNPIWTNTCSN